MWVVKSEKTKGVKSQIAVGVLLFSFIINIFSFEKRMNVSPFYLFTFSL